MKLRGLKPLLPILAPNASLLRDYDTLRNSDSIVRAWTKSEKWKRLRWRVLVRDHFVCRMCKIMHTKTSHLVADHIIAHKGSERLFWDEDNLQTLCDTCHNTVKKREDIAQARGTGGGG